MAFRRSTRSAVRRHDDPLGDVPQGYHPTGTYPDSGLGMGGFQMGMSGMQMGMSGMQMQGGMGMGLPPPGSSWHSMGMGYQFGQQQQYHQYPYSHGQQYYGHGGAEMMSHHHQQSYQHEEPSTSSGRSLRTRPGPSTSSGMGVASQGRISSTSSAASNLKRKRAAAGHKRGGDSGAEEIELDDDDDDFEAGTAPSGSQTKKKGPVMETCLTVDQMVHNCLYYFFLHLHKKVVIKKSDLVKNAMNSQHKQFSEVMNKVEAAITDVFGMRLIRCWKNKDNNYTLAKTDAYQSEEAASSGSTGPTPGPSSMTLSQASRKGPGGMGGAQGGKDKGVTSTECYMISSKYPNNISDSVIQRDPEADSKKTVLYLILCTIFMLNRPITEAQIWQIIQKMQLNQMVCEKKVDLRKFLKSEFVLSAYLSMEQEKLNREEARMKRQQESASNPENDNDNDNMSKAEDYTSVKYSWGPRAEVEYSKYHMLKFVAARFAGRQPYEFTVQYNIVKKTERDLMDKEPHGEGEDQNTESLQEAGRNGSALQVRRKAGASQETFSIDGDNTETETEDQ